MGVYYFILLFIGLCFLIAGAFWPGVSKQNKIVMLLFVVGTQAVLGSILLFMPGSSELLDILLNWNQ